MSPAFRRLSLLVRKWRRAFRVVPSDSARPEETSPRPGETSLSPGAGETSLSRGAGETSGPSPLCPAGRRGAEVLSFRKLLSPTGPGRGTEGLSRQRPPVLQSSLPTRDAQPRSTGRGHSSTGRSHSSAPVRHVTLQPVQQVALSESVCTPEHSTFIKHIESLFGEYTVKI